MTRPFGAASATALVVANAIGAGVFTTSGFALDELGERRWVMLAWLVGGLIALAGAVSYGRLAAVVRESGGEYVFLSRVVHPAAGFVAGWVSLLAGFTGAIAFAAHAFEQYAWPWDVERPAWLPYGTLAVLSIVVFGALHAAFARRGLVAQNAIVALKLVLLGTFVVYAAVRRADGAWTGLTLPELEPGFAPLAFAGSLVWISLAYSGFNAAVYVAEEVREPERTIPRAMVGGTACVLALYLALNAVFLYAPPPGSVAGRPEVAVSAAWVLGGEGLAIAMRALVALALLTSVSSMIVAGPRVYARMARDGVLPAVLAGGAPRAGTDDVPRAAIVLQAALAAVVVVVTKLQELLSYLGLTLSLSAAATVASLFLLRRRGVALGGLGIPAFYVASTLSLAALFALENPAHIAATAATVVVGLALWLATRRWTRAR